MFVERFLNFLEESVAISYHFDELDVSCLAHTFKVMGLTLDVVAANNIIGAIFGRFLCRKYSA